MTLRRWLAGLVGEFSVWLQNRLWPTYSQRHPVATPPRNADVLAWMESRGWNN